ncbi:hypothetical protein CHS0354_005621 [Potamilus streckersoni]|uniref:Uncharacterized protein n=1 Tax=Potamilus streckersoni TaxID=2493646 RepID=A0AAE0SAR4_9BIVA|nr:hypothetical protein CHS0354_005621 [Potamilus streckersoni]
MRMSQYYSLWKQYYLPRNRLPCAYLDIVLSGSSIIYQGIACHTHVLKLSSVEAVLFTKESLAMRMSQYYSLWKQYYSPRNRLPCACLDIALSGSIIIYQGIACHAHVSILVSLEAVLFTKESLAMRMSRHCSLWKQYYLPRNRLPYACFNIIPSGSSIIYQGIACHAHVSILFPLEAVLFTKELLAMRMSRYLSLWKQYYLPRNRLPCACLNIVPSGSSIIYQGIACHAHVSILFPLEAVMFTKE